MNSTAGTSSTTLSPPQALAATPADSSAQADAELQAALRIRQGLLLAGAGVLLFALTLPMTRLAGGTAGAPQLPPDFVAFGRAVVAALLSIVWLLLRRAAWPTRAQWPILLIGGAGVVLGFPLGLGFAVREVPAAHAAVVTGLLPLATALVATVWLRERAGAAFWACAALGCALVLAYAWQRGGGALSHGDFLLLAAVASAACGYVAGARLAGMGMPPEQVICWMLVASLPVTVVLAGRQVVEHAAAWRAGSVGLAAWLGFVYVAVVSMWLGFFAWYRGLAMAGTLRASQLQLVQPFLAMLAAVPLLGEALDALTVGCALAVVACVAAGQRLHRHVKPAPARVPA
jgi:drug/metabolite transporter (DMT)-like permease